MERLVRPMKRILGRKRAQDAQALICALCAPSRLSSDIHQVQADRRGSGAAAPILGQLWAAVACSRFVRPSHGRSHRPVFALQLTGFGQLD